MVWAKVARQVVRLGNWSWPLVPTTGASLDLLGCIVVGAPLQAALTSAVHILWARALAGDEATVLIQKSVLMCQFN